MPHTGAAGSQSQLGSYPGCMVPCFKARRWTDTSSTPAVSVTNHLSGESGNQTANLPVIGRPNLTTEPPQEELHCKNIKSRMLKNKEQTSSMTSCPLEMTS